MQTSALNESAEPGRARKFTKRLATCSGALISFLIITGALWVLFNSLQQVETREILFHFSTQPTSTIAVAYGLTVLSYLTVTAYDVIAQRQINRPVSYGQTCMASFLASTFGNNIGFAMVTGSSIRYRIYSKLGLSVLEVAGICTLCGFTTLLGMVTIFAVALIFQTEGSVLTNSVIGQGSSRGIGFAIITVIAAYIAVSRFRPLRLRTHNWSLTLPSASTLSAQVLVSTFNLSMVAMIIYGLLPRETAVDPVTFLGVYALAIMAGSASNVPGGLGVFETVLLLGLPELCRAALLASILLFRCVYYLTPLVLAAILFAAFESSQQRHKLVAIQNRASNWWSDVGPQVMSLMVLVGGSLLLVSSVLPLGEQGQPLLRSTPLPVIEIAQFGETIAGFFLVLMARGISRRSRSSHRHIMQLLIAGLVTSQIKAFDVHELTLLSLILGMLWMTRDQFYRRARLSELGFTAEWLSLFSAIFVIILWLGLFSYKNLVYQPSLWVQFSWEHDYSRFLRSGLTILCLVIVTGVVTGLRSRPASGTAANQFSDDITQLIGRSSNALVNLALLGDKQFLFSDSGEAFLMYRVSGDYWITLGDPVGPTTEHAQLLLSFRELSERQMGIPVYYRVGPEQLHLYLENLAFSVVEIGAEARFPLHRHLVDDQPDSDVSKLAETNLGQNFQAKWFGVGELVKLSAELQRIAEHCPRSSRCNEMSFARSGFKPAHHSDWPCLVVYHENRALAFAMLWPTADHSELGVDLIRYDRNAPESLLDTLLVQLYMTAQQQGYQWLNMGMAPIQEVETHVLAPLWLRTGPLIFSHSEHFQGIGQLRPYFDKFGPLWRNQYLALPDGIDPSKALGEIASLNAG